MKELPQDPTWVDSWAVEPEEIELPIETSLVKDGDGFAQVLVAAYDKKIPEFEGRTGWSLLFYGDDTCPYCVDLYDGLVELGDQLKLKGETLPFHRTYSEPSEIEEWNENFTQIDDFRERFDIKYRPTIFLLEGNTVKHVFYSSPENLLEFLQTAETELDNAQ